MTSMELCPKCRTSITLTPYKLFFEESIARAYQNPVQSEVSCLKSSLENPCADMEVLAGEIARVESMLDVLKAHHAHLNRHIQRSIQFIRSSSICRLPTEVLGIIFASACTSFERSGYKTPLSISLVCSKWRDIALCTPSMWTHIYVAPYADGLDLYQHYLKRCGDIPISVKVEIPYEDRHTTDDCDNNFPYEETYDYHLELVSDVYQHYAQWRVAELCMNLEDINLLGPYIQESESLLESLTLVNDGNAHSAMCGLLQ
ncbi:hypothetical protein CPB85DRAFT_676503 [Mucidula mucida]|nr:hypothetical protein CPB85DRAFT_676503 [Mucidula mucida]